MRFHERSFLSSVGTGSFRYIEIAYGMVGEQEEELNVLRAKSTGHRLISFAGRDLVCL